MPGERQALRAPTCDEGVIVVSKLGSPTSHTVRPRFSASAHAVKSMQRPASVVGTFLWAADALGAQVIEDEVGAVDEELRLL